ncbi:MAG: class I tRNA ligase family protein [Thermoplasmata archaeon]|nr:class I tRNA ligase family protein [Thermoplasmata archaeon]
MSLRIRDSLTGRVRRVAARTGRPLALYVCGPTVYDVAHVGHARTYLYFDVIRRWLRDQSVPVRHVMNITDFEDKITARAAELGIGWKALARREERRFLDDLDALGILPPHETPRASDFVPQMVATARHLAATGRLEQRTDGWYFRDDPREDERNFAVGDRLARHAVPQAGVPFPQDGTAKDFLVWRPQERPAPSWASPWGSGMPGWHLECYAMANQYLGLPVDLHGGGNDLVFPHHYAENEITLALNDETFSRVFLHTAFVTQAGQKMSKSVGNLVPLRLALSAVGPDALRWYLLSTPYHQRLEWRRPDLDRAEMEYLDLRQRLAPTLSAGGGGTLSASTLAHTVGGMVRDIGEGFRVHAALDRIRRYADLVDRAATPRFARGDRQTARRELVRAERLLGIRLTSSSPAM